VICQISWNNLLQLTENFPQHFCSQSYQYSHDDNGGSMFIQKSEHLTTMWGIKPKEDHYLMKNCHKSLKTDIKKNLTYCNLFLCLR